MNVTVHQRPGVYSAYDASSVVSGSGGGKQVGLVAVNTKATANEVKIVTSYDGAVNAFGQGTMAELIRLALKNGAGSVAAVPIASGEGYGDGFAALEGLEDVTAVICDSTDGDVQKAMKESVETASANRRERIAVAAGGAEETVDELIAAIGPNVDIVLDGELYDLSTATGYGTSKGDYYYWLDEFDGPQLVIDGVDNLTIRSNDGSVTGHTIAAIPRYANVLTFQSCSYITLSGFTAGHTREPGYCIGGVLRFQDSDHITVDKCGLYGCGILGVDAEYCTDIRVANCDIYECSQGGVQFWSSEGIAMENNTLRDLGGSDMSFHDCKDVTVNGETLISADISNSLIIQSEYQQDLQALDRFVTEFANAYFYGDTQTLSAGLSKDYTGGVETYSGNTNDVIVCWHEVTLDMWKEADANGTYEFAYPYRENVDSEIAYLTIVVVRENDAWKVSSYSLAE